MKNNKGQTLYYFLVFTMILVVSWAMMLNIAKLIRDRMNMQNMADNIALSIATHKARTMNFVGACNNLMGTLLAIGTQPKLIQIPTYSIRHVASYPYGDRKPNKVHEALDDDVAKLKKAVDTIMTMQETAMKAHLSYVVTLPPRYLLKSYALTISPYRLPTLENAEKTFGLKRNSEGIKYLKTINVQEGNSPHIVYNPFPILSMKEAFMRALEAFPALKAAVRILEIAGLDLDEIFEKAIDLLGFSGFLGEQVYETTDHSWYIVDEENFYKQKIKVTLSKIPNDDNKPLFARLLEINADYSIMHVMSAAAIYNTKGKMFPEKESDLLGPLPLEVEILLNTLVILPQSEQLFEKTRKLINYEPWATIIAFIVEVPVLQAIADRLFYISLGREHSPMVNYQNAKTGGWAAHLVPYKMESDEDNGG